MLTTSPCSMASMATTQNTQSTTVPEFDHAEVSRLTSLIRHELSTLVQDANRKRPLYSKSQTEAVARRDASFKALSEFVVHLDKLRKD